MAEDKGSQLSNQNDLSRRDFLKNSFWGVGAYFGRKLPGLLVQSNSEPTPTLTPEPTFPPEEKGEPFERLMIKDYLIPVADSEGSYAINWATLIFDKPDFAVEVYNDKYEGYIFENKTSSPKVIDLSGTEGKKNYFYRNEGKTCGII